MERKRVLPFVAGPFTEYKPVDVVETVSNSGTRWNWRVGGRHGEGYSRSTLPSAGNMVGVFAVPQNEHVLPYSQARLSLAMKRPR